MSKWGALGRIIAGGLCRWEQEQKERDWNERVIYEQEQRRRQEKEEKKRREAYKRCFGTYPEQTWRR